MAPSKEFLGKLSRLEAVERRWLWSVFATLVLGAISFALSVSHLHLAGIVKREPVLVPPTQFLIITISLAIIVASTVAVLIEYFAFELRVERAVVIKKRKRQDWTRPDDYERDEKS